MPRQVRGTIQRIQLDDQMLMAAHPVVLAPSGVAHAQGDGSAWRDIRLGSNVNIDRGSMPIIRWVDRVGERCQQQSTASYKTKQYVASVSFFCVQVLKICASHYQ